ncbi:MAG TPA: peroxiredoxin [Enhygromyxa sp.]|nr:peroxiredoxin [Enhygromyxa sp.]
MTLRVGQQAPEFETITHKGETISLAKLRGDKAVVLYFYPKDETPGCTAEACSFRDAYEDFTDAGAVVIGVSSDSLDKHRAFAAKHGLPFTLASDADGALRRTYGVNKSMGVLPGRVTYVIDPEGVVREVFSSQMRVKQHVATALAAIKAG